MFDVRRFPTIEGGGTYPSVQYNKNNIATVTPKQIMELIIELRENPPTRDLNNQRFGIPFHNGTTDDLVNFIATIGTESADNVDRFGNRQDVNNVPFNVNADYVEEGSGESYGVFQIDLGYALPYVLSAMSKEYNDELLELSREEDGLVKRNNRAKELYEDEEIKQQVINFLTDPNTIREQLLVAMAVYNDNGLEGWNSWKRYNNKTEDNKEHNELFDKVLGQVQETEWNSWQQNVMQTNEKNNKEVMEILESISTLPANIEETAKSLYAAYSDFKKTGTATEFVDEKLEKLKPFMGIYGK
jgi:hypothetical protein